MRIVRSTLLLIAFLGLASPTLHAATTENKTVVPGIPCPNCPLHPKAHAQGLTAINDNLAKVVSQLQRTDAREQAWNKAIVPFMMKLTEAVTTNANRDSRYGAARTHHDANLRPFSRTAEYAALSLVATRAHTEVLDIYESEKHDQYENAALTAPDASTPVQGLNEAVAEACSAGCVGPQEAQAFTSAGIACHSDPDVAGSWTDPGKLRRLVGTEGCIDASPSSKASKCEAAFNHIMNLGEDYAQQDRLRGNVRQAIDVALRKSNSQNVAQCKLMETRRYKCLPKSAVSDSHQYDQKTEAAKQFGVDCAKKSSNLPSQACDQAQTLALQKGVMTQIPSEANVSGKDINGQSISLMSASQATRQSAMDAQQAQPCDVSAMSDQYERIRAFLERPDIKTYLASPKFVIDVQRRIAALPEKHRKIELAMSTFTERSLYAMAEPAIEQVAFSMLDQQDTTLTSVFANSGITPSTPDRLFVDPSATPSHDVLASLRARLVGYSSP